MTLGRLEEILNEMEEEARRDFRPETFKYVLETIDEIRRRVGLDTSERD